MGMGVMEIIDRTGMIEMTGMADITGTEVITITGMENDMREDKSSTHESRPTRQESLLE